MGNWLASGESQDFAGGRRGERANPIPIVIPCHRVIGSNGKLTGFGGGLPMKEALLNLETRQLGFFVADSAVHAGHGHS